MAATSIAQAVYSSKLISYHGVIEEFLYLSALKGRIEGRHLLDSIVKPLNTHHVKNIKNTLFLLIAGIILVWLTACEETDTNREFNTLMYRCKAADTGFSRHRVWKFNKRAMIVTEYLHGNSEGYEEAYMGHWENDSTFMLSTPLELDSLRTVDAGFGLGETAGVLSFLANKVMIVDRNNIIIPYYGGNGAYPIKEEFYNPK